LKQPYSKTLRDLTSPSVGLLPPDDPRIAAHAIALANIADGVSHTDKTPKDETQIASEKTAMVRLTSNPDNEHAIRTLIKVAESEITRDIHLKQQNTTQKTKTHTKHNTQTVR
jgi:hypothetical protein